MIELPIEITNLIFEFVEGEPKQNYNKVINEFNEYTIEMKKDYKKVLQLNYNDNFDNYPVGYGIMFINYIMKDEYFTYTT